LGDKIVWKPLKNISISSFEAWMEEMNFEPYLHDPLLQSFGWIKNITRAIKKVEPIVGEGNEIEYKYWEALRRWEFILNSLSIARATGGFVFAKKGTGWSQAIEQLKFWIDNRINDPNFRDLFFSGTHFFWDMRQFFASGRQLADPKKLSDEVLGLNPRC
jgi:hypothetical protein